jgi:hypothetical protein
VRRPKDKSEIRSTNIEARNKRECPNPKGSKPAARLAAGKSEARSPKSETNPNAPIVKAQNPPRGFPHVIGDLIGNPVACGTDPNNSRRDAKACPEHRRTGRRENDQSSFIPNQYTATRGAGLRNPKYEYRSTKQAPMTQDTRLKTRPVPPVGDCEHSNSASQ